MISKAMSDTQHTINIKTKVRGFLLGLVPFVVPTFAFADECPEGKLCNPIKSPTVTVFFLDIVNVVIQYGALLIVFFIVFAGFKFVTAQGNSEKVSEARKMLTWIVVEIGRAHV